MASTPSPSGAAGRVLPMGSQALLVEVADNAAALALRRKATRAAVSGSPEWAWLDETVVGARTLLVRLRPGAPPEALHRLRQACSSLLASATDAATDAADRTTVECPSPDGGDVETPEVVAVEVRYDGPDLDDVARLTGLTPEEVVAAHTNTPWRVAFGGFSPGFAYLVGGDPRLRVPRRHEPRPAVPAGSVALAGDYSGVYPQASPGGWQLIGTTDAALWRTDRDPPALLGPGAVVRFVAADAPPAPAHHPALTGRTRIAGGLASPADPSLRRGGRGLQVLATGPLTLLEDLGRRGLADVGVGRSGAADPAAYLLGLRLVGHRTGTGDPAAPASLECTLGGLVVRASGELLIALTGADCDATVDGVPVPHAAPFTIRDGQVLALGAPRAGLRTWLAVRGGLDAAVVLGSRSTDVLSGLGPPALAVGDVLDVGRAPETWPTVDSAPLPRTRPAGIVTLAMTPGPRAHWCDLSDLAGLHGGPERTVSPRSDRSGVRLHGNVIRRLTRFVDTELPPEGMVAGAVQVPPGGEPVVFLADHPVTGGYPVVGVLTPSSLALAAQLRPGDVVRLRLVTA